MQCIHKSYLYVVDKQAIEDDKQFWIRTGYINVKNIESLANGNWNTGLDIFLTGKEWVYYNRSPKYSKHKLHKILFNLGYFKYYEVGCGKCEICRTEKSKEWATKAYCESKCWKNKTFITLTYNNKHLPPDRKLRRSDIQSFWKRLRYHVYKHTKKEPWGKFPNLIMEEIPTNELEETFGFNSKRKNKKVIRYINCGEYGPKTKRPHYHAVIWNFKPDDLRRFSRDRRGYWLYTSKKINEIWKYGYVIIGEATTETAAYVARYCTKKFNRTKEEQEKMKRKKQTEFIGASSRGFIGYYWWINHYDEIKINQGILMKSKKGTHLAKVPRAMCKKWKEINEYDYEWYDYNKNEIGKNNWQKILSQTKLTESEYILQTYKNRMEKLRKLRRDAN